MALSTSFTVRCDFGEAEGCNGNPVAIPMRSRDAAIRYLEQNGWRRRPQGLWACPYCSNKPMIAIIPASALSSRSLSAWDNIKPEKK